MPNADGTLTKEENEKILEWLRTRMVHVDCAICRANMWSISDSMLNAPILYPGGIIQFRKTVPLVGLYCRNCGHFISFSAVVMGIIPSEPSAMTEGKIAAPEVSDAK